MMPEIDNFIVVIYVFLPEFLSKFSVLCITTYCGVWERQENKKDADMADSL